MIKYLIVFILFIKIVHSQEQEYQAIYDPLNCTGVATEYDIMYLAKWKFYPTGGSGSEIDIRYNKVKRVGKIRTTVFENGSLYGRGKWIGRTSSRIYNTLIEINYDNDFASFALKSQFNPDQFRLNGKCLN